MNNSNIVTNYDEVQYYEQDSKPFGYSFGEWTVKWWKWILSMPKSMNPIDDDSGELAALKQPSRDVWFLAGKKGDEDKKLPNRSCRIPADRSILFPVINCEHDLLDSDLKTHQDLIDRVSRDEDTIVRKDCFIDGERIPVQRVKSDPIVFEATMARDNMFNMKQGGGAMFENTFASADGYWVFLKPLPIGKHTISFLGSCESGRLNSGANYNLEVVVFLARIQSKCK